MTQKGYSLRTVVQSASLYSLSDLALRLIGFFLIPLYTRAMNPADYGIVGYTTAITQVLSPAAGLGLIGSLPVLYHAYEDAERKRLISSVFNFTFLYSLCFVLIFTIWGHILFNQITTQVLFNPYILLSIWTVFFSSFYYLPLGIFNMREKTVAYIIYSLGLSLLGVLLIILLVVVYRMGALGVLWAGLISGIVGMATAFLIIRRTYMPIIEWSKLKPLFILALPTLPHFFSSTISRFADRFFLSGMINLTETGIYSLAMLISSVVLMILGGATTALNPIFFRRAHANDRSLPSDWARLSSLFILASALLGLGLALFSHELIQALTPEKYHAAIPLIPVLALGQLLTGLYWLVAPGIGYTRKMWVYPIASFPSLSVNLLLNALLIPQYGSYGAAWAMVCTAAVQLLIFGYFSQRFFPIPYEYRNIVKIVALSLAAFGLIYSLNLQISWSALLIKLALLMFVPIALLALGFFEQREIVSAKLLIGSIFYKKR